MEAIQHAQTLAEGKLKEVPSTPKRGPAEKPPKPTKKVIASKENDDPKNGELLAFSFFARTWRQTSFLCYLACRRHLHQERTVHERCPPKTPASHNSLHCLRESPAAVPHFSFCPDGSGQRGTAAPRASPLPQHGRLVRAPKVCSIHRCPPGQGARDDHLQVLRSPITLFLFLFFCPRLMFGCLFVTLRRESERKRETEH